MNWNKSKQDFYFMLKIYFDAAKPNQEIMHFFLKPALKLSSATAAKLQISTWTQFFKNL